MKNWAIVLGLILLASVMVIPYSHAEDVSEREPIKEKQSAAERIAEFEKAQEEKLKNRKEFDRLLNQLLKKYNVRYENLQYRKYSNTAFYRNTNQHNYASIKSHQPSILLT